MNISKDTVVSFHYILTETESGTFLEDSRKTSAMVYLHGHRGVFPKMEEAFEGKAAGDSFTVSLSAEDAYGMRDEEATQRVSINHVVRQGKAKPKFRPGMLIHLNTKNGPQPAIVLKAGLKTLDVDLNHPLAGKALTFEIEVMGVRAASEEEIAHGHVHGEGGVEH